jgi:hypothetical protein
MSEEDNKRQIINSSISEDFLYDDERSKTSCFSIIEQDKLKSQQYIRLNGQRNRIRYQISESTEHLRNETLLGSRPRYGSDFSLTISPYEQVEKLQE